MEPDLSSLKIAVIGARGLLGSDVADAFSAAGAAVTGLDRPDIEIKRFKSVFETIPSVNWVINCASFSDVDAAETQREEAFDVNSEGARTVARTCARRAMRFLQISTDYVFDGRKSTPVSEQDVPNPVNVFGASKLAGEKAIRAEGGQYLIVRTSGLFGLRGQNFGRTIVERLLMRQPCRMVTDRVFTPTYTRHLALALVRLVGRRRRGIVHAAALGECTPYDFARKAVELMREKADLQGISFAESGLVAPRPLYSVLSQHRYREWTGTLLPVWEQGLADFIEEWREHPEA